MHSYDLILTLSGSLGAALVLGYLTQRLGLSPIAGYLLAGTLVGPHTPGFVADARPGGAARRDRRHPPDVRRRPPVPHRRAARRPVGGHPWGGRAERGRDRIRGGARASGRLGLVGGRDLRPGPGRRQHRGAGPRAVGQQRSAYPGRSHRRRLAGRRGPVHRGRAGVAARHSFGPGTTGTPLWMALGLTAIKVSVLVAFTAVVGTRVIPRVLDYVAATRSRELFTLTVLVIALGIAVGSSLIFSVSMALGAFLAGMVVGRSDYSLRAASEALPMRDAFAVLFFVSVGMLLDPGALIASPALVLGCAGHRARRQAAGRLPARVGAALPLPGGADGGRRAGADRRVFVHPRDHWPRSRRAHRRGDECAGRDIDRVDRAQSSPLPDDAADRALARAATAAPGAAEPRIGRPTRHRPRQEVETWRSRAPRRGHRLSARPAGPSSVCCATTASTRW